MIPKQLNGMRFNRVQFKEKRAFEKGWQNNPYSYELIQEFFPKENFGVLCGKEVRVLDDDTEKKGLIKIFKDNFGETFQVRDHLYFKFDNGHDKKIIFMNGKYHLGELQGEGTYVVGPGSTHPSGEIYEIKNDLDIITISYDKFIEVFGEFIKSEVSYKISPSYKENDYDDDFIKSIKEKWIDGNREALALSVAGYLRKTKKIGLLKALGIIEKICEDCGDEEIQSRLVAVRATYDKDEKDVKGITGLVEKGVKENPGIIFGVEGQAQYFIDRNPIFYDKSNIWWMWNSEETRWVMSDETDILNQIRNDGVDTITSKTRIEIINALKQLGRKNKPIMVEKNWIQFKDKIVDLDTGEVFNATPEYFVTNPVPWTIGESEETPTLDKYFREWVVEDGLQDGSYVDTLYEILAYSCMSKQFLQRLFAFVGSGSNGKGVYLSILGKLLGKDNYCSTELKLLATNNFESSSLYKKQACFMGEVDAYDMQNTNLIKKLSGEDDIRYCFKGKTAFTERSSTTCLMNTNSLPVSPDKSKGFYRRWLIVDFPHEFPVGKDILAEISDNEFENLAKKIITISKRLLKNKKFTNEGDLDIRIKRYEDRSNPMMAFIANHCTEDISKNTPIQMFVKDLNEYLQKNRLRIKNTKEVKMALKEEGFEIRRRVFMFGADTSKMESVLCIASNWGQRTQKTHLDSFSTYSYPCNMSTPKKCPKASLCVPYTKPPLEPKGSEI